MITAALHAMYATVHRALINRYTHSYIVRSSNVAGFGDIATNTAERHCFHDAPPPNNTRSTMLAPYLCRLRSHPLGDRNDESFKIVSESMSEFFEVVAQCCITAVAEQWGKAVA